MKMFGYSNFKKRRAGLTLIETLLYAVIVTFIVAAFLAIVYGILTTREKLHQGIVLQDNKEFVIQKLEWVLQNV